MDQRQGKAKQGCIGCLVIVIIIFIIGAIFSSCTGEEGSKAQASIMAEKFVAESLKSPGSAKFQPPADQNIKYLGEGRYSIRAWVDSQNSFGALVRTHYGCIVKYDGDHRWTLESLEFVD